VIGCDTGPLVAAAIKNDAHHRDCVDLLTALHLAGRRILVPGTVVAEVGYLLAREGGAQVEAQFLTSLSDGTLWPVELTREDYQRSADLVRTYGTLPLGTTDATVIAVCERLELAEVASLDRRHFSVVRPRHVPALTLLPE
jgi:predicted nucleic acid-binding protein